MSPFSRSSEKSFSLHSTLCDTIGVHTRCIAAWKILKRATSFLRDYPRAMEIPGIRQGWHDFETGRTGFRRPHYKWPIRRRFPNELLKRTPRLLRIFKLGRYFQLACIWYRQPNRMPRFHPPVPHPPSFFFSLFFFNRLPSPHPILPWKKTSNRLFFLLLSLFILFIPHRVLPFFFFYIFFSSLLFFKAFHASFPLLQLHIERYLISKEIAMGKFYLHL